MAFIKARSFSPTPHYVKCLTIHIHKYRCNGKAPASMGSRLTEAVETDESLWSFTPQRCPTCNCNIKTPSFASVSQRHLEVASLEDYWRGGSWQIGCSFCKMVSSLMGNICNSTTVEDLTYRRPAGVDFVRLSEAGDKYQLMLQVNQDWAFEWSAGVCLQGKILFLSTVRSYEPANVCG